PRPGVQIGAVEELHGASVAGRSSGSTRSSPKRVYAPDELTPGAALPGHGTENDASRRERTLVRAALFPGTPSGTRADAGARGSFPRNTERDARDSELGAQLAPG